MPSANKSVKQQLRDYLAAEQPARITESVWRALLRLAPVSESYLRELLRDTGLPFDQPYAGIRQHTFEELEGSLREMLEVYRAANDAGDRERARYCRRQVIAAKDRAKFLVKRQSGEGRDGAVDAGVAGKSGGIPGVGGGSEESDGGRDGHG